MPVQSELEKRNIIRLSNKETNRITRECLQTALLELLKSKRMEDISVTELVRKAGVSRTAYYSNYNSFSEILAEFIRENIAFLNDEVWKAINNEEDLFYPVIKKMEEKKDLLILMMKANLENTAFLQMREAININYPTIDNETYYILIAAIGMIRNVILEWVMNECRESVEEISSICNKVTSSIRSQVITNIKAARG